MNRSHASAFPWFGRLRRLALPLLLLTALVVAACGRSADKAPAEDPSTGTATVWTCSMHPQIALPEPGQCPICGMDLIPREGGEPAAADAHDHGAMEAGGMEHGNPEPSATVWTCSMHPQIALPEPGQCPICGMDLIPREDSAPADADARDHGAMEAGGLEHAGGSRGEPAGWACAMNCVPPLPEPGPCPVCGMTMVPVGGAGSGGGTALELSPQAVERASIRTSLVRRRFVERELRVPGEVAPDEGRLSQVSAWIGGRVTAVRGARVGETVRAGTPLYELYGSDLLSAQRELLQPGTASGARERLRRWGVGEAQLERVLAAGEPLETLTIDAPSSGRVLERLVEPGRTVKAGDPLFALADLGRVWVQLEIDESDLALVEPGTAASLRPEGLSGDWFEATVAFVDPVVDTRGRTARARVELDNPGGRLRPGQFVEGRLSLPVKVDGAAPLAVPESAVLHGGERDLVYVETAPGRFEPREVHLGLQGGEWRVVLHGLEPGERVVVQGAFRIDSALQIRGAASLMQPQGGAAGGGHRHGS